MVDILDLERGTGSMSHDVFISYATEDKMVADAICNLLEGRRIRCWIAPRDILPGSSYGGSIINAINNARLMILVFSSKSNQSKFVLNEVERAVSKGISIIPFRIEDIIPSEDMEFFVSRQHWLDALTKPLEQHIQKLAGVVEAILKGTYKEPTPSRNTNHYSNNPYNPETVYQKPAAASQSQQPLPRRWEKWSKIRQMGQGAFIFKYGILAYGLPMGLLAFIALLSTDTTVSIIFGIATFLLGGGLYGTLTWSMSEKRFAQYIKERK